jgi:hypothetical protein
VVSPCDTPAERREAVSQLLEINAAPEPHLAINLDGAERAVDEILTIVTQKHAR